MSEIIVLPIDQVQFKKEFYTRTESKSPSKVQEYSKSIEDGGFPPILLNHEKFLLDGWHRWMAHKERKLKTIEVEILDTSEMDIYTIRRKAASANCRHGQPQTIKEIDKLIRDEYRSKLEDLDQKGRAELKQEMAIDYSRSIAYVRDVTSRIDKDLKTELRETAFNMWMACHSQQEIADEVGYSEPAIREFLNLLRNRKNATTGENAVSSENPLLTETQEFEGEETQDTNSLGTYTIDRRLLLKASHIDEHYKAPIYNVWKQQNKSNTVSHFGNSEIIWLDNLLYLYTNPFDIVIDPFAGSGSTIDLCKDRLRRYLVSDRKPVDIRTDIRNHDVTEGVLSPPTWKDVKLIYLDPLYWKQAENKYSEDPSDLANMDLQSFTQSLAGLVKQYAEKLKRAKATDAYIALIIQPTQWKAPDRDYTDHVADIIKVVKLPIDIRIQAPYESQQCNAQMVEWAKKNKKVLVLSREIIVWKVN